MDKYLKNNIPSDKGFVDTQEIVIDESHGIDLFFYINKIDDNIMFQFNLMNEADKKNCLESIIENISFENINNDVFYNNLVVIDSNMPEIVSWAYLYGFIYGIKELPVLVGFLEKYNPLRYDNVQIYGFKLKKFLANLILGGLPNNDWKGDCYYGGCIVAHIGKKILVCDGKNRDGFEKFLFNHVSFWFQEQADNNGVKISSKDGKHYMNLNLQIRFDA